MGPVPTSMRDMGPGNRHEVLDDHFRLSEHQVHLVLARDEEVEAAAGVASLQGPSAFILQMIDVEDSMRSVKLELSSRRSKTALQQTNAIERHTKLTRSVAKIWSLQAVYMPAAIQRVSNSENTAALNAEDIPLIFPLDLSELERATGCCTGLLVVEQKLCKSQLSTSLDRLRNNLHIKSRLLTSGKIFSSLEFPEIPPNS
ncbi:hypothetical protein FB446DRAFT_791790 [Lentinula raphanica]|nr:hypothetical protein FB446DRAFT_791790 [Lentinula raphanica]